MYIAAFDIGNSFENVFERIIGILPPLLGALAILVIGNWVVKWLAKIVQVALEKMDFDHIVHNAIGGTMVQRIIKQPSHLVGRIVYWLLFFGVVTMAVSALQWAVLDKIVAGVYAYIPSVIAAMLIFLVASAISGAVAKFVQSVMGDTATGKVIASVVPIFVMTIAFFMILNQLKIATDIVNILFTGLVAALSLGSALAFGLGGRDVAGQLLQSAYENGKEKTAQAKADMRVAKQRSEHQLHKAKQAVRDNR
jgi:hypothetical protein